MLPSGIVALGKNDEYCKYFEKALLSDNTWIWQYDQELKIEVLLLPLPCYETDVTHEDDVRMHWMLIDV